MASSTTATPPMRADWTAFGACTNGLTAPPKGATSKASGGATTTPTTTDERGGMGTEAGSVRALTRDRWIVGACLSLACLFAWAWLFWQARQMSQPPAAMGGMAAMATMGPAPGSMAY